MPGWCCIAIAVLEQGTTHVRFQVPLLGPERQLKSGFASAGLLCSKSMCFSDAFVIFVRCTGLPLLFILRFLRSYFLVPPDGPETETVKSAFLLFFFSKRCMRSQNWTARRFHFLGPCQVHFLKFVVSRLQKRNVLVSMKLCRLWRPKVNKLCAAFVGHVRCRLQLKFCSLQ